MNAPHVLSCSFYPRYKVIRGVATVQDAARRVLYSDATVTLETISAAQYEDATGAESAALCAALDRHPRGRA